MMKCMLTMLSLFMKCMLTMPSLFMKCMFSKAFVIYEILRAMSKQRLLPQFGDIYAEIGKCLLRGR